MRSLRQYALRSHGMQCNARSSAPHDGNSSEQDARTPGDTNVGPRVGRGTVAMPRSSLFGCSELLCFAWRVQREEVVVGGSSTAGGRCGRLIPTRGGARGKGQPVSEEGKKGTEELKASEQRRDDDPRLGPDLRFTPLKMQAAGVQAAARPALHCTVSDLLICIAIDRASEISRRICGLRPPVNSR